MHKAIDPELETLRGLRVGVGMTGSFCTFETIFSALGELSALGAELTFVLSYSAQQLASRFGTPAQFGERIAALSEHPPVINIPDAEPLGPAGLLDLFLIAPCTGNTLAKLANGITDTPVTRINIQPANSLFYWVSVYSMSAWIARKMFGLLCAFQCGVLGGGNWTKKLRCYLWRRLEAGL